MKLSATRVASELGVAERTVRRWVGEDRLNATRVGRELLIDLDEARQVRMQSRQGRAASRAADLAELRGRYLELRERVAELEHQVAVERRRALELELRLRSLAA